MPFGIITGTLVIVVGPRIVRRIHVRRIRPVAAAQWYAGQWAELAAEARASVTPHTELTAAALCADLCHAKVASDLPGRVRLRVAQLRGIRWLAKEVEQQLARQPGIERVSVSAATGSVLIYYCRRRYPSIRALLANLGA